MMLPHQWQHETTSGNCAFNVIIFVISTCVLLLGSHLTQHTTGAIDGTHSQTWPAVRGRAPPARRDSLALDVARPGLNSNTSAPRHYPTYYDLIKLPGERAQAAADLIIAPPQLATQNRTRKSPPGQDTRLEPHRVNRRAHQTTRPEHAIARGKNASSSDTLDEEIETMEALIEVLDAANRKLVEQKRRQKFKRAEEEAGGKSAPRADFSVTRASTGGAGAGTNSSAWSPSASSGKRAKFGPTVAGQQLEQPRADPSEQVRSETTRDGVARPQPSLPVSLETEDRQVVEAVGEQKKKTKKKKKQFRRKKSKDRRAPYNATQILDGPAVSAPFKAIIKEGPPAAKHLNESRRSASDSDLVRPGFDNTPMSQNYVGQYQAHPMGVTLDPLGGIMPAPPPEQMQQLHGPHLLLQGHRPIVAHDLLNTPPASSPYEPHHSSQQDNNIEDDERVARPGRPEVFVPNHQRPQLAGNDPRELFSGGPMYESHPQAPTSAAYAPLQALQMLKRQQLLGYGPYQIQQDPYGYTSTTTERPHDKPVVLSEDVDSQPGSGSKPADWSPSDHGKPHRGEPVDGEPPVLPGHVPQAAMNDATQGLHTNRAAMQPQINRQLNNRFGEMNGPGGGVNQPNGLGAPSPALAAAMNPLQHLLDAAKNQQAAALAYERGRLNYELELQKREEAMRRQHEANLERQRVAANQRAAAQEQERQQQQQQQQQQSNEQNGQGGGGEGNADQQQQQQQEQNGDGGNEQQPQRDDSANQQEQEQPNDDSANNQQQQQQDDPDMKNFQNFAGDTDFTDLFPKGVLSDAEIKEMREQQAEQKQRQEQEEQEERDKQRAEAEAEEEQPQGEPASGTSNDGGEQQPEQQPVESGGAQNSEQSATQDAQQPQPQKNTTSDEVVTQPQPQQLQQQQQQQQVRSQPLTGNLGAANASSISQSPQTATIAGLLSYMFKNMSAVNLTPNANNQTGAQKTRRSREHGSSVARPLAQPLMVLDSEYDDRYMKPFLSSLMAINKQQLASQDGRRATSHQSEPPSQASDESSEWSQRKKRHEPGSSSGEPSESASNHLVPLIDFDDLLENYSDSLNA